ncbi:unnamed protein product [Arabis nemorensis]|uniref:Uncharacterized protein n=1 Tax=Arabis nemorensis TaxID=586526 RepID=A0A565CMH6_9BRAS|nr:unnamed protein product [Arabis nemorensis]
MWSKMIVIHHTCLEFHFCNTDNEERNYDDVVEGETEEYGGTSFYQENLNLTASDDDLPSRSQIRSTREATRHSPYIIRRSSSRGRSTSSQRTHMRRSNFEAQIDGRFQRMEESRGQLLDVVRSRQSPKPMYGDALVVLESLPIKPMKTFWWEANKISSPTICKWSTTSKQQENV